MKTMTVQEVHDELENIIQEGLGDKPCLYMLDMLCDVPINTVEYHERNILTRDAVYLAR